MLSHIASTLKHNDLSAYDCSRFHVAIMWKAQWDASGLASLRFCHRKQQTNTDSLVRIHTNKEGGQKWDAPNKWMFCSRIYLCWNGEYDSIVCMWYEWSWFKGSLGVCICVNMCVDTAAYAYVTYTERTAHHDHSSHRVYCYVLLFVVGLASLLSMSPSSALAPVLSSSPALFLLLLLLLLLRKCVLFHIHLCVCVRATHTVLLWNVRHSEHKNGRECFFSLGARVCVYVCALCGNVFVYVLCVVENSSRARLTLIASQMPIHTTNFFLIQLCYMSKRFDFDFVFRISYIQII